jgi:hypothetical protein
MAVVLSFVLCAIAVAEQLTVKVPQGEYEFWLQWWQDVATREKYTESQSAEGKHTKATGAELRVDLGEVPPKAKASTLLVLNSRTGLLAHGETEKGGTLYLSAADFHLVPELKVTVRLPDEQARLMAEVVLEHAGITNTGLVEISGGEGKAVFNEVDTRESTLLRVRAPGYQEVQHPVSLVDENGKAVSSIEVALSRAVSAPPTAPVEPPAPTQRIGWIIFFVVAAVAAGVVSLILGTVSLLSRDAGFPAASRQWLASIWGPPMLGTVGWWVCSGLKVIAAPAEEGWLFLLPVLAWACLLVSVAAARAGRRFLSASALIAVAAGASTGLAFLSPSGGGLQWTTFLFGLLALASSVVGGGVIAGVRAVAGEEPKAREAAICPYCGQRRDPVTGACGCEPGRPRTAAGPRLVIESGERAGETLALGQRLTIGREAGNDLLVADMTVSRRHCVLIREGDKVIVRDEGSANGTLVNGERVTEKTLAAGDRIQVGSVV